MSPILAVNFVIKLVDAGREPGSTTIWAAVVAAALWGVALVARLMALIVQNRLIRLEERIRLAEILPDDLRGRIPELRVRQLIALRFAPDGEIPDLVRRTLAGDLAAPKDIKRAINVWRPDTLRV